MLLLSLAQMGTQVLRDLRRRSTARVGQRIPFGVTTKLMTQEKQHGTLHRQAMSGRPIISGIPKQSVYHLSETIISTNRRSTPRGLLGR